MSPLLPLLISLLALGVGIVNSAIQFSNWRAKRPKVRVELKQGVKADFSPGGIENTQFVIVTVTVTGEPVGLKGIDIPWPGTMVFGDGWSLGLYDPFVPAGIPDVDDPIGARCVLAAGQTRSWKLVLNRVVAMGESLDPGPHALHANVTLANEKVVQSNTIMWTPPVRRPQQSTDG